jgi:cell division protein YceG involved in septum cleavage
MKLGRSIRVIFILAILITGGFVFWLFNALHSPVSHRSANRYIVIEQGSTSNGILEVLGEHDIIQVPLATRMG